jgi:hypothetical protein
MYALIYKMIDINKNVSNRPEHVDFLRRLLREGKIIAGWKFPEYEPGQDGSCPGIYGGTDAAGLPSCACDLRDRP